MKNLEFYDKFYVGFQKRDNNQGDDLLGFLTHDTGDAAFEKRKSTVDNWRHKIIPPINLVNDPRSGFKILDSKTRHYTNNKVFRVYDPAGFELEITSENLSDLISRTVINKGEILDRLVWAREGAKNYLITESSQEYTEFKRGPVKFDLTPGMILINKTKTCAYRYEGRFNFRYIISRDHILYQEGGGTTRENRHHYGYYRSAPIAGREVEYTLSKPKQAHVYSIMYINQTEDDNGAEIYEMRKHHERNHYETSSAPIKNLDPLEFCLLTPAQNSIKKMFGDNRKPVDGNSTINNDLIHSNVTGYGDGVVIFFDTPKAARAYAPTDEEIIATNKYDMVESRYYKPTPETAKKFEQEHTVIKRTVVRD